MTQLPLGGPLKSPESENSFKDACLDLDLTQIDDELLMKSLLVLNSPQQEPGGGPSFRRRLRGLFHFQKTHPIDVDTSYSLSRPLSTRGGSSVQLLTAEQDGCVPILQDNTLVAVASLSSGSSSSYCSILQSPVALQR